MNGYIATDQPIPDWVKNYIPRYNEAIEEELKNFLIRYFPYIYTGDLRFAWSNLPPLYNSSQNREKKPAGPMLPFHPILRN